MSLLWALAKALLMAYVEQASARLVLGHFIPRAVFVPFPDFQFTISFLTDLGPTIVISSFSATSATRLTHPAPTH